MTLTDEQIAELRALLAKMTPGEWVAAPYSSMVGAPIVASPSGRPVAKVTYFHLGPEFDNHNRESAANAAGIVALVNSAEPMLDELEALRAEVARLREALEPSGSTKAAYHGEFVFDLFRGISNAGIDQYEKVYVPWGTVKQIMKTIAARAAQVQP